MSTSDFSSIASTPLITYQWLPDSQVHKISFAESSRQAVDEWLTVMKSLYDRLASTDKIRLLFDMSQSGTMPLIYAIGEGKRFADNLTFHPESRVAMLHPADRIRPFANVVLNALKMKHLRTRFFDVEDQDGAIAWLTEI